MCKVSYIHSQISQVHDSSSAVQTLDDYFLPPVNRENNVSNSTPAIYGASFFFLLNKFMELLYFCFLHFCKNQGVIIYYSSLYLYTKAEEPKKKCSPV